MNYTRAHLIAERMANYQHVNYAVVRAKLGELSKGFYAECANTVPPEQVVVVIAPDGTETAPRS